MIEINRILFRSYFFMMRERKKNACVHACLTNVMSSRFKYSIARVYVNTKAGIVKLEFLFLSTFHIPDIFSFSFINFFNSGSFMDFFKHKKTLCTIPCLSKGSC